MTDSIKPFGPPSSESPALREAFDQSIGSTFFRQMLKSLRSSTGKPAYFHGGQAEEIFQSQLDEILISDLASATGDSFSSELFRQQFPNHSGQAPQSAGAPQFPASTMQSEKSTQGQQSAHVFDIDA